MVYVDSSPLDVVEYGFGKELLVPDIYSYADDPSKTSLIIKVFDSKKQLKLGDRTPKDKFDELSGKFRYATYFPSIEIFDGYIKQLELIRDEWEGILNKRDV